MDANFVEIERTFGAMEAEGSITIQKAGAADDITYERSIDMRFVGQGFEVNVPIPGGDFSSFTHDDIRQYYNNRYESLYGRTFEAPLEFVSFRVNARLPERPLQLPKIGKRVGSLQDAIKGTRAAFSLLAKDFIKYTVYDRNRLFPGVKFDGPAIIEERESTSIVGEDVSVCVDDYGFLWIDFKEAE
jgi:N-methylhydantoinase A